MIKTPCEIIVWNFLPALRRELVKAMIKNGFKRNEIAKIFDMTESAISQYVKSKRGTNFEFDEKMKKQIEKSAIKIANSKSRETFITETHRFCSLLKKQGVFCRLHKKENPFLSGCDLYKNLD